MNKKITTFLLFMLICTQVHADPFIEGLDIQRKDTAPFRAPTERFKDYYHVKRIYSALAWKGVPIKYREFWENMILQEERGCFGYHAAKQQFRIFQDIIRVVFEEILDFEMKKNFYFFRVPDDPGLNDHHDAFDFLRLYPYVDDRRSEQSTQVLSINYVLYGNYQRLKQCSVAYFTKNTSWFTINYEQKVKYLFDSVGLPKHVIPELFLIGSEFMNAESGVLFQFFDHSHYDPVQKDAYEFIDHNCYPALSCGKYDNNVNGPISNLFQGTRLTKFPDQMRLIMNNSYSLNPYSSLSIRRYDDLDPNVVKNYETELRKAIRKLSYDPIKKSIYRQKLRGYWNAAQ